MEQKEDPLADAIDRSVAVAKRLHVFANEVTDWYAAESAEEAAQLCRQHHIDNKTGCDEDEMGLDFYQEDDDKIIGIVPDEDQSLPAVKKTCKAWAMDNGKGFLCSTEY